MTDLEGHTGYESSTLPVTNGDACNTSATEDSQHLYRLHKAVYNGELRTVTAIMRRQDTDIEKKDKHGNTALHIAAMLGRKECIEVLLAQNAPVNVRNLQGQTPLNEAISYGDRNIIKTILRRLRQQASSAMDEQKPEVKKALSSIEDFEMTLKWEFHSWVPLVSRFLPCDECKIYKRGCKIRMDTTLVDFKDMKWERGDLSFLFDGENLGSNSLLVMDNIGKCYQYVRDQTEEIVDGDVDLLMSTDNETGKMSTKDITFSRAHSGFIFKSDKTEMVGDHKADFYNVHGIKVISVKRREHLSEDDIKRNKIQLDHANLQKALSENAANDHAKDRESLPPPSPNTIPWEDYISSPAGKPPCIGRPIKCKNYNKTFHASIAVSNEFPVTVDQVITVLESIKPLRHFNKLREFLTSKLPPGFPVKLEIPVFPTVTARISFEFFAWRKDLRPDFFNVPRNYIEDTKRFSGL